MKTATLPLERNGSSPIEEAPATELTERALSLSVCIRRFGNLKRLSMDAIEVDADKTLLGAHKRLVDSDKFRAIAKLDSQI